MNSLEFLSKHGLVHQTKLFKAKPSPIPRLTNSIPVKKMQFPNPLIMPPPEGTCNGIKLVTNTLKHPKARKGI